MAKPVITDAEKARELGLVSRTVADGAIAQVFATLAVADAIDRQTAAIKEADANAGQRWRDGGCS